jgi:UDP-N-acetylmuramoyl-L-alanyl-D-glutamate--2,6-diaminopimelate ligase
MSRGHFASDAGPGRFNLRHVLGLGITDLATDSRAVKPGDTFVAYPGQLHDGRRFIPQALARGARAVLWDSDGFRWRGEWHVPNVGVPHLRRHAGKVAHEVYGRPSARMWVIGITGTNGKTSCSHWIAQSLTQLGRKSALIGTLGSGFPGSLSETSNTTPDAVWLHRRMGELAAQGASSVVMEVSSHGLAQDRLSGIEFDVALLTNLTRDHLDYHCTMRRYKAAKTRLFRWPSLSAAVLNLDDAFGRELCVRAARPGMMLMGYGFGHARGMLPRRVVRVRGTNLTLDAGGVAFDVTTPWGAATLKSRFPGRFNAENLLGSLATLLASDVRLDDAVEVLSRVEPVPGRMQRLEGVGRWPLVVIDYAHTPDALHNVLTALREPAAANAGHLICVFGCGGGRDRGKRSEMGRIATATADHVIVTSDNPRDEDPQAIIADIVAGAGADCVVEPDRGTAIRMALAAAGRHDVVLIAGKGHERYQEIAGRRLPFDDSAVARSALAELRK